MTPAYTIPPAPTSVGGFDGKAVICALIIAVGANVAATQYAARQFGYQDTLGKPVICSALKTPCLYEPWAWARWTWRTMLRPASDDSVRGTLSIASVIAFLGVFGAAPAAFYFAQHMRVRAMARQAQHLHGSAQWAKPREIRKSDLMTAQQGVYVGAWRNGKHLRYLRHNGQDHILAFAPTRSGKGVSLVIPTLLAWNGSVVVYDIKGENWEKTAGWRSTLGPVFRFAPADPERSSKFNPLAEMRLHTDHDVEDAMRIAELLTASVKGGDTPYWHDAGKALMTGAVLHACYVADTEDRVACLRDVYDALTKPGQEFRECLAEWLLFPHRNGRPHPAVAREAQTMMDKEDRDFGGVLSTARVALELYIDPIVAANTAESDFRISDLVNYDRPVSLYIVVPASQQERLRPLVRLMFTLLVNRLTDEHVANRHRLLMMIDEFPTLSDMPVFAHALSYMGGYGIKAFLIAQDIRQIEAAYGNKESICSNCNVRVAFAPNTYETARLLSEMLGKQTVLRTAYSFSGKRLAPLPGSMSTSMDHQERPLLTPDEIMRLRQPVKRGDGTDERIVAPGEMLIFQAGNRPILGTQLLYFLDPELKRRAAIAPPDEWPALPGARPERTEAQPEDNTDDELEDDTLYPV